jgi:hypothetical protein
MIIVGSCIELKTTSGLAYSGTLFCKIVSRFEPPSCTSKIMTSGTVGSNLQILLIHFLLLLQILISLLVY